jgi:hypothetical protein
MSATFTDIVKAQRQQGAGVFSSLGKAAGQRTLERIDPRNYLFSRTGIMAALFPGVKGYQAKAAKDTSTLKTSSSTISTGQVELITNKLDELRLEQKQTSKNTLVLPLMARDFDIMKKNIIKLVKLNGGIPTSRAESFFMTQKQKEEALEARFGKKSPTKVEMKAQEKESILSKLFGWLFSGFKGGLAGVLNGLLTTLLKGGLLAGILVGIGKYFNDPEFRKNVNETLDKFMKTVFGADYWENLKKGLLIVVGGFLAVKTALIAFEVFMYRLISRLSGGLGLPDVIPDTTPDNKGGGKGEKPKGGKTPKSKAPVPKSGGRPGFLSRLVTRGNVFTGLMLYSPELGNGELPEFERKMQEKNSTSPTKTSPTSTQPTPLSADAESMAELIRSKFKAAGFNDVQAEAAVANAIAESGLNPYAHNTRGEDSVGLFQMNRKGGLGEGHSVENLKDPNYNIDLAIDAAKKSKAFLASNTIDDAVAAFVRDVERPAHKELEIEKRTQIALGKKPELERGRTFTDSETTLASAASAVPSMNDIGKFLETGSVEFENMVREFLKSTGEVTINSDSSTKVSTSSSGQVGTPGSAYDNDFVPRLLVGVA